MAVDFKAKQAEFAAYIRNPQQNPKPVDVAPERMAMYRELFFNNIDSFLSSNFPVLHTILSPEEWQELAYDFFANHRNQTPYFAEIAEEFLAYLQTERDNPNDYPFLLELAHYEWVEMALSIAQDQPIWGDSTFSQDVLNRAIQLSPLAWPLAYQYPVERISPQFLPRSAPEQASYLIVYRDASDEVHFMQTTAFTLRLLELIEQQPTISGQAALQSVATDAQLSIEQTLQFGLPTLQQLADKGIVIPAVVA